MAEASGTAGSDTGASGAKPGANQVSEQRFEHGRQLAGRISVGERSFTLSFKLRTTDQSISVASLHKQFIGKFIKKAEGSVSFQSTSKVEGATKSSFTSAEEFPKQDRDHRRFFNRSIIRMKDGVHTLFRIEHKMIMSDRVANVKEKLFPYLCSKNLYMINGDLIMTEHRKILWLYGAHTSMISFSRHQDILNTMLTDCPGVKEMRQKYSNISEGDTTPLLTIVPHTISWGTGNDRVQAEVAAVTAVTGYSKMMKEILMLLPPESTPYELIPEGFAQMTSSDKYKELLKAHNDAKNSVQGIAVVGMGQSDMDKKFVREGEEHKSVYHYLSTNCPGIVTIEPTKFLESQGRWMCIVKRNAYDNAKLFLTDFLENKYLVTLGAAAREINLQLFDTLPRIAESLPLGADMKTRVDAIDARYCQNRPNQSTSQTENAWERPRRFVFNLDDAEEFPPMNANQATPPSNATPSGNTNAPNTAAAAAPSSGNATGPQNQSHATNPRDDDTRASDAHADARSTTGATAISAESTMISEMKTFMSEQSQQMSQMLEDNRKLMVTFQEMVKNSQEESRHNRELMTKMMNMMLPPRAPPNPPQYQQGVSQSTPVSPYTHQYGFGYGFPAYPTPASTIVNSTPAHIPVDPRARHQELLRQQIQDPTLQPPPPAPVHEHQPCHQAPGGPPQGTASPESSAPPDTIMLDREKRATATAHNQPKAKRVVVTNAQGLPNIVGPSSPSPNGTTMLPSSILNTPLPSPATGLAPAQTPLQAANTTTSPSRTQHVDQPPPIQGTATPPSASSLQTQPVGQPPPTPAEAHLARGITHHEITHGLAQESATVDGNGTPPTHSSFDSSQMGEFSEPVQEEEFHDDLIDDANEFRHPDFTDTKSPGQISPATNPRPPLPRLRTIPSNSCRHPAELSDYNLRANHDVGASLQALLSRDDLGKQYRRAGPSTTNHVSEKWRHDVIRLYFQNVNGLLSTNEGTDILDAFFHMNSIQADIFGFAETHLNCHLDWLSAIIHRAKRKVWDQCKLAISSADNEWPTAYQRGGTMLGITGPLVGRYRNQIIDPMGRWCGFELLGRDGRTLLILCCYQVVQRGGTHGPGTAYSQQATMLRINGIDNPRPRASFVKDLKLLIEHHHRSQHDIILMGDFNEEVGLRADELAQVIEAGNLSDIQAFCHGLDCEEPTYARGQKRVDYVFASERLLLHVIRQGCEPFNMRIFSDHRGLFVNFSYPGFFDRSPCQLAAVTRRDFQYDRPDHIQRYLAYMERYIADHNITDRLSKLLETRNDDAANILDNDITTGMLKAAKSIRRFLRHPWSQALHHAITTRYILSKHLSQLKLKMSMSIPIERMQKILDSPIDLPETVEAANAQLRQAQRNCRQVVKKARALRDEFQSQRILAKQLANPDVDPDTIERSICNRDSMRDMWRKIPSSKPQSSKGLSMIKVPDPADADPTDANTQFRTVDEPTEMETMITDRNKQHFKQAEGRALADPHLTAAIGWGGTLPVANDILEGTADLDALCYNYHAKAIFRHCRRITSELPAQISRASLQDAYLHWPVTTSTAPSNCNLSHLHVLFHPHGLDKDDDPERFYAAQDTREILWDIHHGIVCYATNNGFCFDRWQNVVTTMIEKESGNPKLHHLRVIHLYENDYNLILGVKFRELMHTLEDNDELNTSCYGSRANRTSLDPVFIELMQYDYCQLTRYDEIDFINDAKSCYDCIIVSASNVAARSRGLHRNITNIHGSMLQHAKYRIKTQLGVSSIYYEDSADSPVFGTGQGSKLSPPIWANNCSIYFDIYDEQCHGAHYYDIYSDVRISLGMVGFVDDNKCQTNCHPRDRATLSTKAMADGQLWSNILEASGGKLEHPKLLYYWRQMHFDPHGFPILRSGTFGEPIVFTNELGTGITIKQRSVFQSYKTLGTYQSIGGKPIQQFKELIKRSHKLVRILATSSCHGNEAWQFYSLVYSKSIGYPLPTSRLTPRQLDKIQGPMIALILNRLGYPRRLSHATAFGPRRYGGLGLPSAHTTLCSSEVKLFLRHLRTLGTSRKPHQPNILLRINLNRLQHCAGVGYPILEFASRPLPHLEGTWLPSFRSTLARINGSVQVADLHIPPLQRQGNFYIMEKALASPTLTKREIRMIHLCRYYFDGATTISDICNAAGTALAPGVMSGVNTKLSSTSTGAEPYQEHPGPMAWRAWRKFLKLICSDHYGSLRVPLGPWLKHAPALRRRWPYLFSPTEQRLYRWCNIEYEVLKLTRPMIYTFTPESATTTLPRDGIPVDVDIVEDGWRVRAVGSVCSSTHAASNDITHDDSNDRTQCDSVLSFGEYIDSLPDHERVQLLRYDLLGHEIFDLCASLTDLDNIYLVTDGGAASNYGSYGWILCTKQGDQLARGSGAVFGLTPGSYRSEISGCRGGLLFIIHLCRYCECDLPQGALSFYCDNQSFIDKLESFREYRLALPSCCLDAEWDLLASVHHLMTNFPSLPSVHHVKGHQDRTKPYHELPLVAQLNVDADQMATYELENFGDPKPTVPFNPACRVQLSIAGRTITCDYENAIQDSLYLSDLRGYLRTRFDWLLPTFDSIDWPSCHTVYSKYPRYRTFFYKFGWKKLPTGDRLHKREDRYDHRCPTCLQPHETDDHVFQCFHRDRQRWRTKLVAGIVHKLAPFLDPELLVLIRTGLHSYLQNRPELVSIRFPAMNSSNSFADPYCKLAAAQSAIGWDHFLRGKLVTDWTRLQYRYAARYGLLDKSKQWNTWLIRYMANNCFDLWSQRNRHRHGADTTTRNAKALEQAKRDVRDMYKQRENVLPRDQHIFSASLKTHLEQPLQPLLEWIALNKRLIKLSVRQAADAARKTKFNSREYFNIQPPARRTCRHRAPPTQSRQYLSRYLTEFFTVSAGTRVPLNPIPEFLPLLQDAPRPRLGQRRLKDFFPDHPG